MASPAQMQLPPLDPSTRNLLAGLFGVYVLELVLANLSVPVDALRLFPLGNGFEIWQPVTRFLVQGRENAVGVLISLVVLYFFLPILPRLLDRRQWIEALGASTLAAMLVPMAAELAGLLTPAARTGWSVLIPAMIVVFGLANPKSSILLMFVLPVQASFFVWGTLFLSLFFLLVSPTTAALEPIGAWIGIYTWWNLRGPGRRRRELLGRADRIERELHRFTVLDGGRSKRPQGDQGGDDWVN